MTSGSFGGTAVDWVLRRGEVRAGQLTVPVPGPYPRVTRLELEAGAPDLCPLFGSGVGLTGGVWVAFSTKWAIPAEKEGEGLGSWLGFRKAEILGRGSSSSSSDTTLSGSRRHFFLSAFSLCFSLFVFSVWAMSVRMSERSSLGQIEVEGLAKLPVVVEVVPSTLGVVTIGSLRVVFGLVDPAISGPTGKKSSQTVIKKGYTSKQVD
jgi:hypothetical protein